MKKSVFIFSLMLAFFAISQSSFSQIVVKVRPVAPRAVAVRRVSPGPAYVWIEPEWWWNPRRHEYAWREGRWVRPRRHAVWVPGSWLEVEGGVRWSPGYWGPRR